MLKDSVSKFVTNFSGNSKDVIVTTNTPPKEVTQAELMSKINTEFQKPFIRNLYQNPEWIQRVFWAVAGTLQNEYDDLGTDVPLDRITMAITKYVKGR